MMPDRQCFTVSKPAWRLSEIRKRRYSGSRQYSSQWQGLIQFLAMHRSATAHQMHRYYSDRFGTDRSLRMHLQTLAAEGDIDVVRAQGLSSPNIYIVTGRGLAKADANAIEPNGGRRRAPSGNHLA